MSVSKSALRADRVGNTLIQKTLDAGTTPIQQGLSAEVVKYVERMLKLAGFNPGVVDNKFTANTTNALKELQRAWGLPETGVLDQKTFNRMKTVQARVRKWGDKLYSVGQKGAGVKTVEQRLRRLGYDVGKADGVYDAKTAEAMKAFAADQKEIKDGVGYAGPKSQQVLAQEISELNHAAYHGRANRTADRLKLDAATGKKVAESTDPQGAKGLGLGSKGKEVANIQSHLRAAGFDPQHTNGVFDERTAAMVREFQRRQKLPVTGLVNAATWKKLRASVLLQDKKHVPAQRLNEKSSAVLRTEKLLKKLGFNPGKIDGIFDKKTVAAVKKAEKMVGRPVNGVVSTTDIQKLQQASKGVTLSQLHRIMPALPMSKAKAYLPLLNRAMAEGHINTKKRKAAFLAQLAHESVQLKYFEEIASGAAYEGRTDLGNTHPGDGVRYKGRGPIQLTGRANYRAAGKALHLPLEANPKMAAKPAVGFRIAVWYWTTRGLNKLADQGAFKEITRRINGGYNGLSSRYAYYRKALAVL